MKTKKCKLCQIEFNDNPFIYCDECMSLIKTLGQYLQKNNIEKGNPKLAKILHDIKTGKYDVN